MSGYQTAKTSETETGSKGMTDSGYCGGRVAFSPTTTLRGTIGSALASVGRRWEDVRGIVLHVDYRTGEQEITQGEFDEELGFMRVAGPAVAATLDLEQDAPWDAGWVPGERETRKFASTLWLPGMILRFAPGFGIGEGVVCEAFSTEAPTIALDALAGRSAPRGPTAPEHTVTDGLRVLRSIARQLGSEDDRDSERCIVEAVEVVEKALAHGRVDGPSTADGRFPYFLKEVWSARRRADGTRLEPGERISGVGVSPDAFGPRVDPYTRFWMEDLGRIEKGAAFFVVEAPFRLVPAVGPQTIDPEPTAGVAE